MSLGTLNSLPLTALSAVALDTETTGLDASKDRLVQIGAVGIRGAELRDGDRFQTLVNPGVKIPPTASSIHNIFDDDLVSAPEPGRALRALVDFIGSRVVIGHSIGFDLEILAREAAYCDQDLPSYRALDIRPLAVSVAPSLADYSLDALCAWAEIKIERRHAAFEDAVATAEVFVRLLPLLREKNIRTLAEAEAVCRTVTLREARHRGGLPEAGEASGDPATARAFQYLDGYPYAHRVADVMSAPPAIVSGDCRVKEALDILLVQGISSVFVEGANEEIGIATERDLLRVIAANGGTAFETKLSDIMSAPLQCVLSDDLIYRAIGRIERMNIRHLGVRDRSGALVGVVTTRNLLRHRAGAAMALGDEIEAAADEADLGLAWSKVSAVAKSLLDQDVGVGRIANVISSEICALTRRATLIGEKRLLADGGGPPPRPYAMLVLGSAGRGESLMAADQDNAIIIDAEEITPDDDAWFAALGEHVADILDGVGITYCKGGVMAKNAIWRRGEADWRAEIGHWVNRQDPADLLNVDIFFDAITVHGDENLGRSIWEYAFDLGGRSPSFLRALEGSVAGWRPPLTLFGGFQTGADERVDLKLRGLFPIVGAARILSIKTRTPARGTGERLRNAAAADAISDSTVHALEHAHQTITTAILKQQIIDLELGRSLGPRVDPRILDKQERNELRDAVRRSSDAVELVREGMF